LRAISKLDYYSNLHFTKHLHNFENLDNCLVLKGIVSCKVSRSNVMISSVWMVTFSFNNAMLSNYAMGVVVANVAVGVLLVTF